MSAAFVAEAEHGLVAIEWPKADIAADYLEPERFGTLLTGARDEARRLALQPDQGGAIVYTVQRDAGECLRFVWGDASIANDPEDDVLHRLAVLPPPSTYSLSFSNRRDVVGEDEARIQVHAAAALVRRGIAIRLAWAVRRLRRELGW